MRIAIFDDEAIARRILKDKVEAYFKRCRRDVICDVYACPAEFHTDGNQYAMIFMDYQMPGMDGLTFSKELRKKGVKSEIVFVSAYPENVFQTFEVKAYQFLTKPIEQKTLERTLNAFLQETQKIRKYLIIKHEGRELKIDYDDILYIQASNKNSLIHLEDKIYSQPKLLADIEKSLLDNNFVRTHRSFLVNMWNVSILEDDQIKMSNGEYVKLSRSNLFTFRDTYFQYLQLLSGF